MTGPELAALDPRPMTGAGFERCLGDGLAASDWFRILHGRVSWPSAKRPERLLGARAHRGQAETVLTVDAATHVLLVERVRGGERQVL